MRTTNTQLSIVIPAYNEETRLPGTLEALAAYCGELCSAWEVLVVVEKSADRTVELASVVAARHPEISLIVNHVQRGKGYALRTGVGMASGNIILTMDADLSVPVDYIGEFLDYLGTHPDVDVLAGDRQHPETVIAVKQSAVRRFMGGAFRSVVRGLAGSHLPADTQCGFKALRRAAARAIYSRQTIDGFACDVEVLLLAERLGFSVKSRPVLWINAPDSKVRLVQDSLLMLWDVLRVRRRVARSMALMPFDPNVAARSPETVERQV